nr:hypothetical protein [Tanacetum cinerariifolium]
MKSFNPNNKSRGLDDEGHDVESDGLRLDEEDEAVPRGQQQAAMVVRIAVRAPLGLGDRALRCQELALEEDHVYSTFEVRQDSGSALESERPERVSTSGLLPILPSPSVVPSPVSLPMIPLTVPSPIASPVATSTATIPVDEDRFIEVGAQLELYRSILQDHIQRLGAMPPTLFTEID